jgi:hypothetical protein
MKMIASTKLAKAQRAMQSGKQYGLANSGASRRLYIRFRILKTAQRYFSTLLQKPLQSASFSLSSPPTKVSAVVFILP